MISSIDNMLLLSCFLFPAGSIGLLTTSLFRNYIFSSSNEDKCTKNIGNRILVFQFVCRGKDCISAFEVYNIIISFVFAQVKSRPLSKFLTQTVIETGDILGRPVELILGFSQLEWERANCGMFLYWHGRLIEVRSWLVGYC